MDKEVIQGLQMVLTQNLEAAIITVIKVLGSTPRKQGTKMLVLADGTTTGTIGGGCGEAEAKREAFQVIRDHTSKKYELDMTADLAEEEGMVCGGIMELFIDYLGAQSSPEQKSLMDNYLVALENRSNPVLVTITESVEENAGKKIMMLKEGQVFGDLGRPDLNQIALENAQVKGKKCHSSVINLDSAFQANEKKGTGTAFQLLVEPPVSGVQLLILGAGHIAMPLASMAKILGYEVTVVDDRPSFANPARFSTVDRVICNDFGKVLDDLKIHPQTYVVIVTRGHRHDKVCLKKVIHQPAGYIGMIGSSRRVKAMLTELQEEGIPNKLLQRLYSPIGLCIGAETPEELAVSILGEIIKVYKESDRSADPDDLVK